MSGSRRAQHRNAGSRSQNSSGKKVWRPVGVRNAFRITNSVVEGAGKCCVAIRDIAPRELIETGETPLARWTLQGGRPSAAAAAEATAKAFFASDKETRKAWLSLSVGEDSMEEECQAQQVREAIVRVAIDAGCNDEVSIEEGLRASKIASINCFHGLEEGELCLFHWCSRFNHACRPNAEYGLAEGTSAIRIRAIAPIREGEEINLCYLGEHVLMSRTLRRRMLKDRYGFECICSICTTEFDEFSARACQACGARVVVLPGRDTAPPSCCQEGPVLLEGNEEDSEMRAVLLREEWEALMLDKRADLDEFAERTRLSIKRLTSKGLQHHVAMVRYRILLVEVLATLVKRRQRAKQFQAAQTLADEGYDIMKAVIEWFQSEWNPLKSCAAMCTVEAVVAMEGALQCIRSSKNRKRVAELRQFLQGHPE